MNTSIIRILQRSVISPYYKQYAGFFLFLFFVLFGTQRSFDDAVLFHSAIMSTILTSKMFFTIAMGVWLFYTFKVLHFIYSTISKPQYLFLQTLHSLSYAQRFTHILYQQAILLLPATIYFLFVISLGLYHQHYLSVAGIIIVGLLLWIGSTVVGVRLLAIAGNNNKAGITQKVIRIFPNNLIGFILKFCTQHIFSSLVTIKLISFFCLYGLARLDNEVYEQRILWMIYISALVGHGVIVYKIHEFTETGLTILRNMAYPIAKIILSLLAVYTILLIPEIWALKSIATHQHQIADYSWLIIFGPCFLLLIHGLLYTDQQKLEHYFSLLFGIWIVFVFFSLSPHRWLMTGFAVLLALICFYTSYYKYQPHYESKNK